MKIITTTHYNRPRATSRLLEQLSNCTGIKEYKVVCCIEPGCSEVLDIIKNCQLTTEIIENPRLLGLWTNKKQALKIGFGQSDYVIHMEDDIVIYKDTLRYYEWCDKTYKHDKSIFAVCSTCRTMREDIDSIINPYYAVHRFNTYNPHGWAMWKDRWEELGDWSGQDTELKTTYLKHRKCIFPIVSRTQHFHDESGVISNREIEDALEVAGHKKGLFYKNGVATNPLGMEWVKLNDTQIKSRMPKETYDRGNKTDLWAGSTTFPYTDDKFHEMVRLNLISMRPRIMINGLVEMIDYIEQNDGKLGKMLEVGCYVGESTEVFANRYGLVIAVDPWEDIRNKDGVLKYPHEMSVVESCFNTRLNKHDNIVKMKMCSVDALTLIQDKSLDFVYLDGLHDYENVKLDLDWINKINDDGFIGGHDWNGRFDGVRQAVRERVGEPDMIFSDNSWICRKKQS